MSSLKRNRQLRWKPSYLRRQGHLTKAQRRYLRMLWPLYGVELSYGSKTHPRLLFQRDGPLHLEIGFGKGESLLHRAQLQPESNFIGVEVHKPAVAALLHKINIQNLQNVAVIRQDVLLFLSDHLQEAIFSEIWMFYPQPWPEDQSRRLLRPFTLDLLSNFANNDTRIFFSTDVEETAQSALRAVQASNHWQVHREPHLHSRPTWQQRSYYEQKSILEGRTSHHFCFSSETDPILG